MMIGVATGKHIFIVNIWAPLPPAYCALFLTIVKSLFGTGHFAHRRHGEDMWSMCSHPEAEGSKCSPDTKTRAHPVLSELATNDDACSTRPFGPGCYCYPSEKDDSCAKGFPCGGNRSQYEQGTCGGALDTIVCPRENATEWREFWVQNNTRDYCANTQIRTCSDGNGCVGVKYRNDTSTYSRCQQEYGNLATGHYAASGLQLPVKVRVGLETK